MKRQRGVNVTNHPKVEDVHVAAMATMGKKKVKKEAEQKGGKSVMEEEEEERNESREVGGLLLQGARDSVMSWCWDEYMPPLLGGVVDEQMSWSFTWYPGWDMDFMGEAFSALYSDVVWDDDIWNLKKEIPIPLDKKTLI